MNTLENGISTYDRGPMNFPMNTSIIISFTRAMNLLQRIFEPAWYLYGTTFRIPGEFFTHENSETGRHFSSRNSVIIQSHTHTTTRSQRTFVYRRSQRMVWATRISPFSQLNIRVFGDVFKKRLLGNHIYGTLLPLLAYRYNYPISITFSEGVFVQIFFN